MSRFSWPRLPADDTELHSLMSAIDAALTAEGVKPFQRPMHVGFKFWEALGWSGNALPNKALALLPGYEGDVLLAKAFAWYQSMYGEKLKSDMAYGFAPARLGNAVWRIRAGVTFGTVRLFVDRNLANRGSTVPNTREHGSATFNILCAVEDLPQGLADQLPEPVLRDHMDFHALMHHALQWRSNLPRTELLRMAHADYDESTASVLGGRFGQARWAAQQSVEKTLKGLLTIGGTPYPTGGAKGHSLAHVADLMKDKHGVTLSPQVLALAECAPAVRYGAESTEAQAVVSNHAVLEVLDQLRRSTATAALLGMYKPAK